MIRDHSGTELEAATGGVAGRATTGVGDGVGVGVGVGDAELGVGVGVADGVVGDAGAEVVGSLGAVGSVGFVGPVGSAVVGGAVVGLSGSVGCAGSDVGSGSVVASRGAPAAAVGVSASAVAPKPAMTTIDVSPARTTAIHRTVVRMDSFELAATLPTRNMGVGLFQYE
jgi:hypothetical protein